MTRVATKMERSPQIGPLVLFSAGTHPGMPIIVMDVALWDGKSRSMVTRFQRCRLDNSINSAHGHQPKGTTVLVGDGTHNVEHGIPGPLSECISTSAEADAHERVITTQSVKFEGSRLSQCGRTSTSIYVCMCTSLPTERWTRNSLHDMALGLL